MEMLARNEFEPGWLNAAGGNRRAKAKAKRRFCLSVAARAQGCANGVAQTKQRPQDPNDEPAEVMLKRIRAQRDRVESKLGRVIGGRRGAARR